MWTSADVDVVHLVLRGQLARATQTHQGGLVIASPSSSQTRCKCAAAGCVEVSHRAGVPAFRPATPAPAASPGALSSDDQDMPHWYL